MTSVLLKDMTMPLSVGWPRMQASVMDKESCCVFL